MATQADVKTNSVGLGERESRRRQYAPNLLSALDEAVRRFRAEARAYRAPERAFGHKGHMDKGVRRAMAASFDDFARLIEDHAAALRAKTESDAPK